MKMLTESKIEKVHALIQQRKALSHKIEKMLGNGNGKLTYKAAKKAYDAVTSGIDKPKLVVIDGLGIKHHRKASPKVVRQRKLQGKYMGAVRNLTKAQRKQVSRIREAHGYVKAIAKAKSLQA